jgi:hypothetical protein
VTDTFHTRKLAAVCMSNDLAFPVLDLQQTPNGTYQLGLTKREYFAALAMHAILTGAVTRGCPAHEWADQSMALKCADALIDALTDEERDPDYDGAPYCSYGHRTRESCDCGPIAENE